LKRRENRFLWSKNARKEGGAGRFNEKHEEGRNNRERVFQKDDKKAQKDLKIFYLKEKRRKKPFERSKRYGNEED
jgi:hypothetical protein